MLSYVPSYVLSNVLSYVCVHMCSHTCALIRVLSCVLSYVCSTAAMKSCWTKPNVCELLCELSLGNHRHWAVIETSAVTNIRLLQFGIELISGFFVMVVAGTLIWSGAHRVQDCLVCRSKVQLNCSAGRGLSQELKWSWGASCLSSIFSVRARISQLQLLLDT